MKYDELIRISGSLDKDWEIVLEDISKIYDPSSPKFQSPKLDIYIELLKKGRVFPPIILDEENWVVDGTHRLHAYRRINRKRVPVLRPVGKGTGKVVKDTVYKNLDGEFYYSDETPVCLRCGNQMHFVPYGYVPEPMMEFPEGLPRGPIYYCRLDKIILNKRKFLLWRLVS